MEHAPRAPGYSRRQLRQSGREQICFRRRRRRRRRWPRPSSAADCRSSRVRPNERATNLTNQPLPAPALASSSCSPCFVRSSPVRFAAPPPARGAAIKARTKLNLMEFASVRAANRKVDDFFASSLEGD